MAAYAALVSLMQILDQIEHHPSPPIAMDKKQVETLTEIVMFLQEFLEGYKSPYADSDEADPLEMCIADAVYAAEDVIESHIAEQLRPSVLALYEALRNVIEDMDLIVEVKEGKLLGEVSDDMFKTLRYLIQDIELIEERVTKHMDLIFALNGNLHRQASYSSTSADFYKIFAFKNQLQRQVSETTDSSTYADLYETRVDFRVDMDLDLIKKDVKEIIAIKDQLEIQVSASSDSLASTNFYKSLQKVIEDMDLIKKDVKEIVVLKDHTQVSGGSSTSSVSRPNSTTMVGFDDVMIQLMEMLIYGQPCRQVISIAGMGGIGVCVALDPGDAGGGYLARSRNGITRKS